MEVLFGAATDTGRSREHNEDNFLVDEALRLFVVCDGMGGHAAGEVASAIAVRAIREVVADNSEVLENASSQRDEGEGNGVLRLLVYAVQEACARIYDLAQEHPEKRGMGTTCSVLALYANRAYIAHVGDSRIYLVRDDQAHQLTEDHTLANQMLRRGKIRSLDQVEAKYQNVVTRAVGVYESVEVDTLEFDCRAEDRFLLCSDGLSGYLDSAEEMTAFLVQTGKDSEPGEVCNQLITYANGQGGKDNITAVIVDIVSAGPGALRRPEMGLVMEGLRSSPVCQYLGYKEMVQLFNRTRTHAVEAGQWVVQEGAAGEAMFVTIRGRFTRHRSGAEPEDILPAECFGELALVDEAPRLASVRCEEAGLLASISRRDFYELMQRDPTLAVKLLWNLTQLVGTRLRNAHGMIPGPRAMEGAAAESSSSVQELSTADMFAIESLPEAGAHRDVPTEPGARRSRDVLLGETQPGESGKASTLDRPARRRHARSDAGRRSSVLTQTGNDE